jgi:hypothetical protein
LARLHLRLSLGNNATLGVLAEATEDLSVVSDLGLRIDRSLSRAAAIGDIERMWRERPSALIEQMSTVDESAVADIQGLVELRELVDSFFERGPRPPEFWFEEWYRWQRRYAKRGRYSVPPVTPWSGVELLNFSTAAPSGLYDRLVSAEAARRLPSIPVIESVSYRSPFEVILIVTAGLLGAGCKYGTFVELLKLARDWSMTRAQAQANVEKTTAEAREINARASKTEVETAILRELAARGVSASDLAQLNLSEREVDAIRRLSTPGTEVTVEDE